MDNDEYIVLKDMNGKYVAIDIVHLYENLAANSFKIFGMTIPVIARMLYLYNMQGGVVPPTCESVDEIFNGGNEAEG